MYNKEGVARCHADRQTIYRETTSARSTQTDVNCQFYLPPSLMLHSSLRLLRFHYLLRFILPMAEREINVIP